MSLKSLSSKLYLAIAALALAMWMFGVSGGTILTVVFFALMMTMHLGGHGGHGGSTTDASTEEGADHHEQRFRSEGSLGARPKPAPDRTDPPQPRSGCH